MRAQELATDDLRLIGSEIQMVLQWVIRDIFVLRDFVQLAHYLEKSPTGLESSDLINTQKIFGIVARCRKIYHQVRFIDGSGMEVIRINYDGRQTLLVPPAQLQRKKHRYYFKDAMQMQKGQVYISPMDLNIEHNQIEIPHVPTIRYATPVVDQSGKKRGVIVINVLGSALFNVLDRQQKLMRHYGKQYFLIDPQGFFLFHPQPSKTFGFMFNNDERLQRYEPKLMDSIASLNQAAMVRHSDLTGQKTLIAFQHVPLWTGPLDHFQWQLDGTSPKPTENILISPGKAYWTLLVAQSQADLIAGMDDHTTPFIVFTLILLTGCILVSIIVGSSVSRPVVSLAKAARRIHRGDLSSRAKIYSFNEMGRFSQIFNAMATQLEESVDQLKTSEKKYRTIFENSRDCFLVTNEMNRIIDLNQTGAKLLGVNTEQGHQIAIAFPWAEKDDEARKHFHSLLTNEGYVKNYQIKIRRTDGTIRECLMTATARWDYKGKLIGFEGALRDITERLKQDRAKRQFQKQLQKEIIMAEERERHSLGQLLHEELAQNLALVHLKIQKAKADLAPEDYALNTELEYSLTLLGQMIKQIRTMVFDLYPAMMDSQGLIPTMEWYAQSFSKRTGIPVVIYDLQHHIIFTKPQEIYLFRTFKELLHNVFKHAHAQEVVVTVVEKNGHLRFIVDDDGRGFNPQSVLEDPQQISGIGLHSIQEWITAMDGRFSVETGDAKGTRVLIEIPVGNGHGETDD